jgi:hypothetical protein
MCLHLFHALDESVRSRMVFGMTQSLLPRLQRGLCALASRVTKAQFRQEHVLVWAGDEEDGNPLIMIKHAMPKNIALFSRQARDECKDRVGKFMTLEFRDHEYNDWNRKLWVHIGKFSKSTQVPNVEFHAAIVTFGKFPRSEEGRCKREQGECNMANEMEFHRDQISEVVAGFPKLRSMSIHLYVQGSDAQRAALYHQAVLCNVTGLGSFRVHQVAQEDNLFDIPRSSKVVMQWCPKTRKLKMI